MNEHKHHETIPFSHQELIVLKLFYSGVPARKIRKLYFDPWQLVSKYRNLPQRQFVAVRAKVDQMPYP